MLTNVPPSPSPSVRVHRHPGCGDPLDPPRAPRQPRGQHLQGVGVLPGLSGSTAGAAVGLRRGHGVDTLAMEVNVTRHPGPGRGERRRGSRQSRRGRRPDSGRGLRCGPRSRWTDPGTIKAGRRHTSDPERLTEHTRDPERAGHTHQSWCRAAHDSKPPSPPPHPPHRRAPHLDHRAVSLAGRRTQTEPAAAAL